MEALAPPTMPLRVIAWLAALTLLVAAWRRAQWRRLDADPVAARVFAAAALALAAARGFNTAALAGVVLHFSGATIAVLLLGWARACIALAVASAAAAALGVAWIDPALDYLVGAALPVAVSVGAGGAAARWVPPNIFTYVMFNAFFAGAAAMAASTLAKSAVVALLGGRQASAYLAAAPLLGFGEAFFSGTVMAVVVVYRPQWCRAFDDRLYLGPGSPM